MKWFRFYSAALDDPKVQRLPGDLFKAWVNLLCLANDSEARGTLPSLPDIAFRLRLDEAAAAVIVAELQARGLIDTDDDLMRPHNWDERQRKSDDVAARVRQSRAKSSSSDTRKNKPNRRNVTRNEHVSTQTRLDTDTDTDVPVIQATVVPPDTVATENGTNVPPAAAEATSNPAFALVEALCAALKQPVSVLSQPERAKQCVAAKRLVANGVSPPDIAAAVHWLTAQTWMTGGIDMFTVEKYLTRWRLSGKPDGTVAFDPLKLPPNSARRAAATGKGVIG